MARAAPGAWPGTADVHLPIRHGPAGRGQRTAVGGTSVPSAAACGVSLPAWKPSRDFWFRSGKVLCSLGPPAANVPRARSMGSHRQKLLRRPWAYGRFGLAFPPCFAPVRTGTQAGGTSSAFHLSQSAANSLNFAGSRSARLVCSPRSLVRLYKCAPSVLAPPLRSTSAAPSQVP